MANAHFNPPPNWPSPPHPNWRPPASWQPDPAWGPIPEGWELWASDQDGNPNGQSDQVPSDQGLPQLELLQRSEPNGEKAKRAGHSPAQVRLSRATRKAIENPLWTTLGAILTIIGVVVSVAQLYQAAQTPPVDLEITSITLDGQHSLSADVSGPGAPTVGAVAVTPIDITLQNRGGEPSLITGIDATVVYFQQLKDCTFARPSGQDIAAQYQLEIPMSGTTPSSKSLHSEIRFEVKPDAADRMVLTLGPETQQDFATTPMVMAVNLALVHDDNAVKELGTVSLVTTVSAAEAQIEAPASADPRVQKCAQDNLEHLDELFAIQSTRSQLLEQLRSSYRASATTG